MNINEAYNYCIKLLSIKDRTSAEIILKLKQKKYPDNIIEETISKLMDYGYINDVKYIESWLKDKSNQPGMSRKSMYYKLLQKGLDKELIDSKFAEILIDDYSSALASAKKKLKSLNGDFKTNRVKIFSYLAGKGYSSDVCSKIIDELLTED